MEILIRLYVSNIYFLILPRHDKPVRIHTNITVLTYIYSAETYRNLLLINKNLLMYMSEVFSNKQKKTKKPKILNVFNQLVEKPKE